MGVQGELKRVEMHVCLLGFHLSNGHFVHSLLAMASGGHALLIPHPPPQRNPASASDVSSAPAKNLPALNFSRLRQQLDEFQKVTLNPRTHASTGSSRFIRLPYKTASLWRSRRSADASTKLDHPATMAAAARALQSPAGRNGFSSMRACSQERRRRRRQRRRSSCDRARSRSKFL